jgi:hypothetical protein
VLFQFVYHWILQRQALFTIRFDNSESLESSSVAHRGARELDKRIVLMEKRVECDFGTTREMICMK